MSDQPKRVASKAALQTLVYHDEADLAFVSATDDNYKFDADSTSVHDGDLVIKPDNVLTVNPGRWLKILFDAGDFDIPVGTVADILEDGVEKVADAKELNFGEGLNVTDEGADRALIEAELATTANKGIVELAEDGESAADLAVQANDARLSDARTPTAHKDSHTAGGDAFLSTDVIEAVVKRLRETGGPTTLTMGAVPDGYLFKRVAADIVGVDPSSISGDDKYVAKYIVGTGTQATHATLALAAAAHAAGASDSVIYVLSGETHAVAANIPLDVSSFDLTIVAHGMTSLIQLNNAVNATMFTTVGTGTLVLKGLNCEGNKAGQGAGSWHGIDVATNCTIRFEGTYFHGFKGNGINTSANGGTLMFSAHHSGADLCDGSGWEFGGNSLARTVVLDGCFGFSNAGNNVNITATPTSCRFMISGGYYMGSTGGSGISAVPGVFVHITGVSAGTNAASGITFGAIGGVVGNICRANTVHGINLESSTSPNSMTCTGNTCSLNSKSGIRATNTRPTITGNLLIDNTEYGILLDNTIATVDNGIVSSNTIRNNGVTFDGIRLVGSTGMAVTSNRIVGGADGIKETTGATSNEYSNNVVSSQSGAAYVIIGSASRIKDPACESGTFTRTAAAGNGTVTTSVGFRPKRVVIYAKDQADAFRFSRGEAVEKENATIAQACQRDDGTPGPSHDYTNVLNVQSFAGVGYTATVTLLGAANGSSQVNFETTFVVVGAGLDLDVKWFAER